MREFDAMWGFIRIRWKRCLCLLIWQMRIKEWLWRKNNRWYWILFRFSSKRSFLGVLSLSYDKSHIISVLTLSISSCPLLTLSFNFFFFLCSKSSSPSTLIITIIQSLFLFFLSGIKEIEGMDFSAQVIENMIKKSFLTYPHIRYYEVNENRKVNIRHKIENSLVWNH